jgi:hypothetical protein
MPKRKRIKVRRHRRRTKKGKSTIVKQHIRALKSPAIQLRFSDPYGTKKCWKCRAVMNFHDFVKINPQYTKEYLLQIWNDPKVELHCCSCYEKVKETDPNWLKAQLDAVSTWDYGKNALIVIDDNWIDLLNKIRKKKAKYKDKPDQELIRILLQKQYRNYRRIKEPHERFLFDECEESPELYPIDDYDVKMLDRIRDTELLFNLADEELIWKLINRELS